MEQWKIINAKEGIKRGKSEQKIDRIIEQKQKMETLNLNILWIIIHLQSLML